VMDLEDAVAVELKIDPAAWAGGFYAWSADAARDALRDYVTAGIGDRAGCWSSMRPVS
jgi:hypothetical protein